MKDLAENFEKPEHGRYAHESATYAPDGTLVALPSPVKDPLGLGLKGRGGRVIDVGFGEFGSVAGWGAWSKIKGMTILQIELPEEELQSINERARAEGFRDGAEYVLSVVRQQPAPQPYSVEDNPSPQQLAREERLQCWKRWTMNLSKSLPKFGPSFARAWKPSSTGAKLDSRLDPGFKRLC